MNRSPAVIPEAVAITLQVAQALNELQVPCFFTGSLARAVHGVGRTTADSDFVAQLEPQHANLLVDMLEAQFYSPTHWRFAAPSFSTALST